MSENLQVHEESYVSAVCERMSSVLPVFPLRSSSGGREITSGRSRLHASRRPLMPSASSLSGVVMLALFITGILPSVGFSPVPSHASSYLPPSRWPAFAGSTMSKPSSGYLGDHGRAHPCHINSPRCASSVACAARMALTSPRQGLPQMYVVLEMQQSCVKTC